MVELRAWENMNLGNLVRNWAMSPWSIKDLTLCTIELSHNCTTIFLVWDRPNLVSYKILALTSQACRLDCVLGWRCVLLCWVTLMSGSLSLGPTMCVEPKHFVRIGTMVKLIGMVNC